MRAARSIRARSWNESVSSRTKRLREHFHDDAIMELTDLIAFRNLQQVQCRLGRGVAGLLRRGAAASSG
jgi:hypothetical protein